MQAVCAKVILFGEYALLRNGEALAIPLPAFTGKLSMATNKEALSVKSNHQLTMYLEWLKNQAPLHTYIDLLKLERDVKNGLWFHSTIPNNAGLGSSGAVVAALLKHYGNTKLNQKNLYNLQTILSKFEGYFHGTSSGIDPLISFLGKPIQLDEFNMPKEIDLNYRGLFHPFLFPIKGRGKTNELVHFFHQKSLDAAYNKYFKECYLPTNNTLVKAFKEGDENLFWKNIWKLSKQQQHVFAEMIDDELSAIMEEGILGQKFGVKICGSGGGGFALGFAKSKQDISLKFPRAIPL